MIWWFVALTTSFSQRSHTISEVQVGLPGAVLLGAGGADALGVALGGGGADVFDVAPAVVGVDGGVLPELR